MFKAWGKNRASFAGINKEEGVSKKFLALNVHAITQDVS